MNELVQEAKPSNLDTIVANLLAENIIRGKGLFCTAIINHQTRNPNKTSLYAALAALVNSEFPAVGDLLFKRLFCHVAVFNDQYDNNLTSPLKFLAHLCNLEVVTPEVAISLLATFMKRDTDESVMVSEKGTQYGELLGKCFPVVWLMIPGLADGSEAASVCWSLLTYNFVSLDALAYVWSQPLDMTVDQYKFLKYLFRELASGWTESKLLEKIKESRELLQVLFPEDDQSRTQNTLKFFSKIRLNEVAKGLFKMRRIPSANE